MITKERLKELIEQGADIWQVIDNEVYQLRKDLYQHWVVKEDRIEWYDKIVPSGACYILFEYLFETKADAEWQVEFGCIERVERLVLPTWEEFRKWDKLVKFCNNGTNYSMYVFIKNKNTNNCRIIIYADNGEQDWFLFEQPLTKENYILACRKAKELFLGGKE